MTPFNVGLRYGAYTGLILVVLALIYYVTGITDLSNPEEGAQRYLGWLNYIIIGVGIVFALKYFKDQNDGFMSYGQGVGTGTLTALVIGIITMVWMLLFFYVVDPTAADTIRQYALDKAMEDQGLSEEELEQAAGIMNFFTSPVFLSIATVISTTLLGLVISLIASAFMKENRA